MAPCSGNVITPRMIRRGQVQIGDKIELEDMRVSISKENTKETVSVSAEAAVSQRDIAEEKATEAASAAVPASTVPASTVPEAGIVSASADAAPETAIPASIPGQAQSNAAETMQADTVPAAAVPQTQNSSVNENGVYLRPQNNAYMQGNTGMPGNTGMNMQGNAGTQSHMNMQGSTAPTYSDWNTTFQANTAAIPLIFQNMTDYVNSLENTGQQSPSFGVPSNPLVPPEYEQTIDYDSAQYMNGFLRTQIGRAMRVEQLIGSNSTEDRYGFLVGVGNNYLLLQDITNGNVAIVDLYSVKYVYVYFNDPVFPSIPFANGGR